MLFWLFFLLFLGVNIYPAWAEDGFKPSPEVFYFLLTPDGLSPDHINLNFECIEGQPITLERTATITSGNETKEVTYRYLCKVDCEDRNIFWHVLPRDPWIKVNSSNRMASVSVIPSLLKNMPPDFCDVWERRVPCFKGFIDAYIYYDQLDCVRISDDNETTIYTESPIDVTLYQFETHEALPVYVYFSPVEELPFVFPTNLHFSGQITDNGTISPFSAAEVKVISGLSGWYAYTNVPWLELKGGEEGVPQGFDDDDTLFITPKAEKMDLFPGPGVYNAQVFVVDRTYQKTKTINISLDLHSSTSKWRTFYYYLPPSKEIMAAQIELMTADYLHFKIFLGDLDASGHLYLEMKHEAYPDYVFAYVNSQEEGPFVIAKYKGSPVKNIDNLFVAENVIPEIEVGPLRFSYLPGEVHFILKEGPTWEEAQKLFVLRVLLKPLYGKWQIVDLYEGKEYRHPDLLEIQEGIGFLRAFWGSYHPQIKYGEEGVLYELWLEAPLSGALLKYAITKVEDGRLEGFWQYSYDRRTYSEPQPFYGVKAGLFDGLGLLPGFSP